MTLVIINDYLKNRRMRLFYDKADFVLVDGVWENRDRLLVELQDTDAFRGRERWCDLAPYHFRMMVTKNLAQVAALGDGDTLDLDNPIVQSLNFLICGLIRCLEKASESQIETMKLVRVGDLDVSVEYQSVMLMDSKPAPRRKRGKDISVVVDNT